MSDSIYREYWKHEIKVEQLSLSGYSKAAENTGFYCRELDMAFDAGVQGGFKPEFIFLTHLHLDHISNLHTLLIGNDKHPKIIIPNNDNFEKLLNNYLKATYWATKFIKSESDKRKFFNYPYQLIRLDVGQNKLLKTHANGEIYVEGLPSEHGVESISFGIFELRKRCKEEYRNLDKNTYIQLRKDNVNFTETYKHFLLCYLSDTIYYPLVNNIDLFTKYPIIIVECTFLTDDDIQSSIKKKHIHWSNLEPIVRSNLQCKFVLTHFSKKYTCNDVKLFFDKNASENPLSNVIIWLSHPNPIIYKDNISKN